ncbi:MAG: ATP-binding protein [Bacteroidales bacterium]|nr:ATP-binding protein [Bacteroidales bacterium]
MNELERVLRDQREELENTDFGSLVTRKEEEQLELDSTVAQIVIGVRRCGKSTLCQKVLRQSGVSFAYANFDDAVLASLKATEMNLLMETLYKIYGEFTHLFLDEVQNIDQWPLFVNRLLRQKIHLVLTGSNANLLSDDLSTHITGRYNEIHLYPFSFEDYCAAKQVDTQGQTTKLEGLRQHALDNYLMSGAMPETFGMKNQGKYIHSLLDAIINKDICKRYKVRYKKTLQQVANGLLDKFCQEVNYQDVQENYHLNSVHTAKNYVSYIEKAYLIRLVPRYSFKSIERQNYRKAYAIDTAFVTDHDDVLQTDSWGWRLENVVCVELLRRMEYATQELFYLRENRNYEVDFAVVDQGHVTELVQVTYDFSNPSAKLYKREVGGLLKGAAATRCHRLTLVMMYGEPRDIHEGNYTVHCVSATDWLLSR